MRLRRIAVKREAFELTPYPFLFFAQISKLFGADYNVERNQTHVIFTRA